MNRRYKGAVPTTFLTLPQVGEVFPGDVLTGAAAEAVAGRTDFEDVDEMPAPEAAESVAAQESEVPSEGEAAVVKPRKTASPKAAADRL